MGNLFSAYCTSTNTLHGKTIIVTGANTGIGKITVQDFYKRGGNVYLACRSMEKAQATVDQIKESCPQDGNLGELKIVELDLTSLSSVRSCAKKILENEQKIDILVNNAGIMTCPFDKTEDGYEIQFGTNHLGHFLFTLLLLPKIHQAAPARIINVSSMAHKYGPLIDVTDLNWEKKSYNTLHAYSHSKLCNILFTKELARKFKERNVHGINTYALHPGVVRTELFRHSGTNVPGLPWIVNNLLGPFLKTPEQGAQTHIYCAVSDECADETGLYYAECKVATSGPASHSEEFAQKLWDASMEYVGLKEDDVFEFLK